MSAYVCVHNNWMFVQIYECGCVHVCLCVHVAVSIIHFVCTCACVYKHIHVQVCSMVLSVYTLIGEGNETVAWEITKGMED